MNRRLGMVVAAVAVLLLGGVGFLVGRSLWQQGKRDLIERGLVQMLPGVSQRIQNFRRVKMEDGRKVWEVAADDARYFEDEGTITVHKPIVAWYLEDGREIGMRGDQGVIRLDDHDVKSVALDGQIEVSLADYKVRTIGAVYDHGLGTISSAGAVAITGKAMDLHGEGMEVDLNAQRLKLLHRVTMRLDPAQLDP